MKWYEKCSGNKDKREKLILNILSTFWENICCKNGSTTAYRLIVCGFATGHMFETLDL